MNLTPLCAAMEAAKLRLPFAYHRGVWAPPHIVRASLAAHGAPLVDPSVMGMQVQFLGGFEESTLLKRRKVS